MTFILAGFVSAAARQCRANLRPLFLPPVVPKHGEDSKEKCKPEEPARPTIAKRIYDVVGGIASTSSMNFCAGSFIIGRFDGALEAWRRVYFYTVIGTASILLFFAFGGNTLTRRMAAARIKKAQRWEEEITKGTKITNGKYHEHLPDSHQVPPVDVVMEKKLS